MLKTHHIHPNTLSNIGGIQCVNEAGIAVRELLVECHMT